MSRFTAAGIAATRRMCADRRAPAPDPEARLAINGIECEMCRRRFRGVGRSPFALARSPLYQNQCMDFVNWIL